MRRLGSRDRRWESTSLCGLGSEGPAQKRLLFPPLVSLFLTVFFFLNPGFLGADIFFSSSEWAFGEVPDTKPVSYTVTVKNSGAEPVSLTLISTCECLTVEPATFDVGPGSSRDWTVTFDPEGYSGEFQNPIIIRTDDPDLPKALFQVHGKINPAGDEDRSTGAAAVPGSGPEGEGSDDPAPSDGPAPVGAEAAGESSAADITMRYYFSPGCRSCTEFVNEEIPRLEKEFGLEITLIQRNVLSPKDYEELTALLAGMERKLEELPVLVFGGRVLQGERRIRRKVRDELEEAAAVGAAAGAGGTVPGPEGSASASDAAAEDGGKPGSDDGRPEDSRPEDGGARAGEAQARKVIPEKLSFLPVIAAGLLDGINPCAFTTIIFLISALAVAGRGRKEVLILGICFAVAVFATYFLVGLGLLSALRTASYFPVVAEIIRWVLVAALAVFAALSIYDYTRIRKGNTPEILLQLPKGIKRRIHASIRERSRSAALVASSLVLGFLISIFELACTGQVYFPTIAYMVQGENRSLGYLLLAVYNFGFIVPLLAVFLLAYAGVGSERITKAFQKNLGTVKLGLAGLFAALAVLTILQG